MKQFVAHFPKTVGLLVVSVCMTAHAGGRAAVGEADTFIPLAEGKPYLHVIHEGRSIKVQRDQDAGYELRGYFARTGRKCPPFCIQPVQPAPGIATIGEVELFDFMENQLRDGSGLLIDARTPAWYRKGTIPGSVSLPFTRFSGGPEAAALTGLLQDLGAKPRQDIGAIGKRLEDWGLVDATDKTARWDFSEARDLVFWCNGPACGQSPRAIRGLLETGYPSDRIQYYRGGMQMWQLWGLTTVVPTH